MYVDYLRNEINNYSDEISANQLKKWNSFRNNINEGIDYYADLFKSTSFFKENYLLITNQLDLYKSEINTIKF